MSEQMKWKLQRRERIHPLALLSQTPGWDLDKIGEARDFRIWETGTMLTSIPGTSFDNWHAWKNYRSTTGNDMR